MLTILQQRLCPCGHDLEYVEILGSGFENLCPNQRCENSKLRYEETEGGRSYRPAEIVEPPFIDEAKRAQAERDREFTSSHYT